MRPRQDGTNLPYVLFLGTTSSMGGFLFGFDIAIITGAGPFLETRFQLSHLALGWAFSSLLFGCVLGSGMVGWITDRFGRRAPWLWVAVLFALTAIASGLAPTFTVFVIARFLGGLAVGGDSVLAPMYAAEVSPPGMRGRMGALYQLAIVVGILISYGINYLLRDIGPSNWRWMFVTGAIPSVALFLLVRRAPETPRYLAKAGRKAEALALLSRINGPEEARREMAEIEASVSEKRGDWTELMKPGTRRALGVGFVLAILIHVSGVNTIIDYAPRILQAAGWKMNAALFSTLIIGANNFVSTLISFWTIDRYGRKPLYIVGSIGMGAALVLLTGAAMTGRFTGPPVLALVLIYVAFFASCIGPVFWTLVPEIFPNKVRGEAMTVPVLTQWLANAFVVLFFPWAFAEMGKVATFAFLAAMCLLQAAFAGRFVPETKGRTLEEIEKFWQPRSSPAASAAAPPEV